ncbi:hypothetical protein KCP75_04715 [Salmonella enterica subsp. enterica]|nr:hypothetical protein KCP75_04715 [Salmonella enterica subsp. enterica]
MGLLRLHLVWAVLAKRVSVCGHRWRPRTSNSESQTSRTTCTLRFLRAVVFPNWLRQPTLVGPSQIVLIAFLIYGGKHRGGNKNLQRIDSSPHKRWLCPACGHENG